MNRRPTPARVHGRVHRTTTRPQTTAADPIGLTEDTAVSRAAPVDRVLAALDSARASGSVEWVAPSVGRWLDAMTDREVDDLLARCDAPDVRMLGAILDRLGPT